MKSFDEWFESQKRILYAEDDEWVAKKGWEARQQEIDELQKRIDNAEHYLKHSFIKSHEVALGLLKGNQNEN